MRGQRFKVQVGYFSGIKGGFNDLACLAGVDMYISAVLGGPSDDEAVSQRFNCYLQRVYISLEEKDHFQFSIRLRFGQDSVPGRALNFCEERI